MAIIAITWTARFNVKSHAAVAIGAVELDGHIIVSRISYCVLHSFSFTAESAEIAEFFNFNLFSALSAFSAVNPFSPDMRHARRI